ncbi:complement C1q-like protein 4 [Melanotaenia boesemani]|uniref:complement C1q-like protein 4 n=1 Tax=Melanotaenia boesemani TaxID=1250792 RepID=UPI001C04976C|nr:complement C1q-like protein 4 [Melanotaenia boesemani]
MRIIWFTLLLALASSVPTKPTEAHNEIQVVQSGLQQPCPQDIQTVLKEMTASLAEQKEKISVLEKLNEVKRVVFSASLYLGGVETLGPFNSFITLVFKRVVTNIGNAYNPHTGIFVTPVRGVYHFEWYIGGHGGPHPAAASLMKNGDRIFTAWEHQASHYGTSSNGAALLLEVGDQVYVTQWSQSIIFDNSSHHTSFSGYLLFTM